MYKECSTSLLGLNTLDRFSAISFKGNNSCDLLFAFLHFAPLKKWSGKGYSERKEFAPLGSKFFPFRLDPFSEGRQKQLNRVSSPESVSIPYNKAVES